MQQVHSVGMIAAVACLAAMVSCEAHAATLRSHIRGSAVKNHAPSATSANPIQMAVQDATRAANALAKAGVESSALREGCGGAPTYKHSKPKAYKDQRTTFYNKTSKTTETVTFKIKDVVEYECEPGHTIDGSKNGLSTYEVTCTENGYFKPAAVCMEASKCGAVPAISNAVPTGEGKLGSAQFQCAAGYSLDGWKVVEGGMGKNNVFEINCQEFSGSYEKFEGECKPSGWAPATETIYVYNKVTEALFTVSCKGTLKKAFGKGDTPDLSAVCGKFTKKSGQCAGLVGAIKGDFTAQLAARKTYEDKAKKDKDWFNRTNADAPGITDKATTFCEGMWGLLKM